MGHVWAKTLELRCLEFEVEEINMQSGVHVWESGQLQPPGARRRGGGSPRPAAAVPRGTQSQEVPGAGSALQGDQAGPEQAPSDIEDNTETPAGAEVPHEGAGLLRRRLLGQPVHHLTGGRGQSGHRCPTPGNAENEPPEKEKEGLSLPRRTLAPAEASSPAPGEGPSGWKRRRVPREGCGAGVPLTPDLAPMQIKVEKDFGFKVVEALDSSWVSREPDKLLPYPTLASSPFD
uniref:Uncharacterized protein n=1 Tax=Myotis myotis TaxID=51298 RepID=A0A7J7V3T1_MYOMY|nr:hypothetical protein mMyoMyo1_008483 [Myotis myotis]